jgi:hypothetical protein
MLDLVPRALGVAQRIEVLLREDHADTALQSEKDVVKVDGVSVFLACLFDFGEDQRRVFPLQSLLQDQKRASENVEQRVLVSSWTRVISLEEVLDSRTNEVETVLEQIELKLVFLLRVLCHW